MSRSSSRIVRLLGPGLCLLLSCLSTSAADWPQFRGPRRDGVSTATGLLREWPKDGPTVAWKATGLGTGFSTVAVAGEHVFTMGDLKDGCYLFALKRSDGSSVWSLKVGNKGGNYAGPRCTPTVVGDRVYALGQFGDLVCVDVAAGKEVWRKNLPRDFKGQSGGWNYTESLLVDGDHLICTPGGSDASMLALDRKTGDVVWKGVVPGGDTAGYSSIVIAEIGGVRQYVQLMANGVVGFAARDGKLLWRYGQQGNRFAGNTANIPTPIVQGDQIFCCAGYGRGGALIQISKEDDKFTVKELYFKRELNNKHGGVIKVGEYLYGDHDDSGRPWCADFKTGKVIWEKKERGEGSGSASVTAADGHLYVRYDNGWVALVQLGGSKYTEICGFKIPNSGSNSWPHPVVVDGKLYLREQNTLWCYDIKRGR